VGPIAVLDAVVKRKIPSLHRESNPRNPIVQPEKMLILPYLDARFEVFTAVKIHIDVFWSQPRGPQWLSYLVISVCSICLYTQYLLKYI